MSIDRELLDAVIRSAVRPVYQPIIELGTMDIVGYEALARWPAYPDVAPIDVFDRARETGALIELDWECRRTAVAGAVQGGLTSPLSLFVNVEPTALGTAAPWPFPEHNFEYLQETGIRIVVELTERDLLADPAAVLAAVGWVRSHGGGIALDDVGSNSDSLALLPLVRPDVVKLDRHLLAGPPTPQIREALAAVNRYAADTGASILFEGIETPEQLDFARAAGATFAQGYMLGLPDAPPVHRASRDGIVAIPFVADTASVQPLDTPAEILDVIETSVATWAQIMAVFDELEAGVDRFQTPGCLVVAIQHPEFYSSRWEEAFEIFARSHTLVGVVGVGPVDTPGVRGTTSNSDPLADQFAFGIIDQNHADAVVARDLGDSGPLEGRRYEWIHTRDRDIVIEVVRSLVGRLGPEKV